MTYQLPKLYPIFPPRLAVGLCADGNQASVMNCVAGPEASGGCKAGAAAGSCCDDGAAAGTNCLSGTGFVVVE